MELVELKNRILKNEIGANPLIFKYSKNKFLCYDYLKAICKNRNKELKYIESLRDISETDSLFDEINPYIFLLDVEEFNENLSSSMLDVIVVTKKLPDKVDVDVIEFSDPVSWQIEDFVATRLPGLNRNEINWLCEVSKYDVYRLDQECKKLELFTKTQQEDIFNQLSEENGYSDLSSFSVMNLISAILSKDKVKINEILHDIDNIDVEGAGLIVLLTRQLKLLIDIQVNPKNTYESLGISKAQFNAISYYNKNKYTNDQLITMFDFLTNLDYRLKNGELSFFDTTTSGDNSKALISYMLVNLLNLNA